MNIAVVFRLFRAMILARVPAVPPPAGERGTEKLGMWCAPPHSQSGPARANRGVLKFRMITYAYKITNLHRTP